MRFLTNNAHVARTDVAKIEVSNATCDDWSESQFALWEMSSAFLSLFFGRLSGCGSLV